MKNKNKIILYSYYSLLLFLPISTFLTNVVLVVFILSTIIFGKPVHNLKKIIFSSLSIFFIYVVILGITNSNFETKEYIKLLPLVLVPVPMCFVTKEKLYKGLLFLFIAITIKQIEAFIGIIDYYSFAEGKTVVLRSYSGINEILNFERPYLGFFSAINIIVAYRVLNNKALFVTSIFFSISIIVLISARLGLIIAILIFIALFLIKYKSYAKYFVAVFAIGISFLLLTNNPLKNRFQQLKYDTRLVIWQAAKYVYYKDPKPIFGIQNQGDVNRALLNYYKEVATFDYQPDKTRFISKKYNTHNQYINEFLRGGVLGVTLFIFPFLVSIFNSFKEKELTNIILTLSSLIFFIVENLLARQIGVYLIAIILALTRITNYEKN